VLYVIGKEEMHVKAGTNFWRRVLLNTFLFFRDNTRSKMANLKVPTDRLLDGDRLPEGHVCEETPVVQADEASLWVRRI
jgi:hypothetical protein